MSTLIFTGSCGVLFSAPNHYVNEWWLIIYATLVTNVSQMEIKICQLSFKNINQKCCLQNGIHFVFASVCYALLLLFRHTLWKGDKCGLGPGTSFFLPFWTRMIFEFRILAPRSSMHVEFWPSQCSDLEFWLFFITFPMPRIDIMCLREMLNVDPFSGDMEFWPTFRRVCGEMCYF